MSPLAKTKEQMQKKKKKERKKEKKNLERTQKVRINFLEL